MSLRTLVAGGTLAALVLGLLAGPATAATSKPTVGFLSPTVTGAEFTTTVTVNRTPKQIASCAYQVDGGATASCGAGTALGKSTAYPLDLTSQGDGQHTLTVTFHVTDGGTATASVSFTIQPPTVFARAWSDLDGVLGYDGVADALIAELVDTNRSGVIDAGDTVATGAYPTSFDLTSSTPSGSRTHVVTSVVAVNATFVSVHGGSDTFGFDHNPYSEQYFEGSSVSNTSFIDYYAVEDGSSDELYVNTGSPGQPGVSVPTSFGTPGTTNDRFVDVSLNP